MQQAALIPAAVTNSSDHRQAGCAVAVDFAIHAESFRQTGYFHRGGDAAYAIGPGTQNVAGTGTDPVGAAVMFTAQALRAEHVD